MTAAAAAYKQRHLANRNEMPVPGSMMATNVAVVLVSNDAHPIKLILSRPTIDNIT